MQPWMKTYTLAPIAGKPWSNGSQLLTPGGAMICITAIITPVPILLTEEGKYVLNLKKISLIDFAMIPEMGRNCP